jgi:hypothetical protein
MSWDTLPPGSLPPEKPKFQPSAPASPGTILRSEFDALSPHDKARAMRERWVVIDDPETARKLVTITQAQFDKMPQVGRDQFLARGGRVAE